MELTYNRRRVTAAGAVAVGAGLVAGIPGAAGPAQAATPRYCAPDTVYSTSNYTDGFIPETAASSAVRGPATIAVTIAKGTSFTTTFSTTNSGGFSISAEGIELSARRDLGNAVQYSYTITNTQTITYQVPAGKVQRITGGFFTKNYDWKANSINGNCDGTHTTTGTATSPKGTYGYKLQDV